MSTSIMYVNISCRYLSKFWNNIEKYSKFGNNKYHSRNVVSFDRTVKRWHVKYSDSDSESLSEEELASGVQLYKKNCNVN